MARLIEQFSAALKTLKAGDAMEGGPIKATYAEWNRYVF